MLQEPALIPMYAGMRTCPEWRSDGLCDCWRWDVFIIGELDDERFGHDLKNPEWVRVVPVTPVSADSSGLCAGDWCKRMALSAGWWLGPAVHNTTGMDAGSTCKECYQIWVGKIEIMQARQGARAPATAPWVPTDLVCLEPPAEEASSPR